MTVRLMASVRAIGFGVLCALAIASQARADEILTVDQAFDLGDPLHGYCGTSYVGSSCTDNGTVTPFSPADIAAGFGFAADPKSISGGSWLIAILVPQNITGSGSETFTVGETAGAGNTAKTVSAIKVGTTWSSGDLASYLGLTSSTPANKFGAFAVAGDSGVSAFDVYVANLGAATLFNQTNAVTPPQPLLTLGGSPIVAGLDITAFLTSTSVSCSSTGCAGGGKTVATAPSSVLQSGGTTKVPEPTTFSLLTAGIVAVVAGRIRRRRILA